MKGAFLRTLLCLLDNESIMGYNVHFDNPSQVSAWISTLTPEQRQIFNQGQIHSYTLLIDQIRQSKIKLLNKWHKLEEEEETGQVPFIESRIELLDIYEEFYQRRVDRMNDRLEAPSLLTSTDPEYA